MFAPDDEQYLLRRFARGEVVLFLGAGFSSEARNRHGDMMPDSRQLAAKMWSLLDYAGDYDGTVLADMYEALLGSGKNDTEITEFLEGQLLTGEIPLSYDQLVRPYWYRIYTTNVDDLLQRVYRRNDAAPRLTPASFPAEELRERDAALLTLQAVYLNGVLPCAPRELTFSVRQYARRAAVTSPLYTAFLGDYSYNPALFVGTELNEPLFWQHLEVREGRQRGVAELRPKSFLVVPRISPPKRVQLEALNVIPVEGTASDLLAWLGSISTRLASREDVLRETLPSVVALFSRTGKIEGSSAELREFGIAFHTVPTSMQVTSDRSFYLLGATPRWEDLFQDLDAPREITERMFHAIEHQFNSGTGISVHALLGSAGCGKSTILKRLALRLAQAGRLVFTSDSDNLPEAGVVVTALQQLPQRSVLIFDNADIAFRRIAEIVTLSSSLPVPPIVLVGSRLNEYDRRGTTLQRASEIVETEIPHLTRKEIVSILDVLELNGLLGPLQGMSQAERVNEFEARDRAGQQLLVAMREATSGKGFDMIIEHEFGGLFPIEVKTIYLCVALATDAGYRLSPRQMIAASSLPPSEVLHALARTLRGIVLPSGYRGEQLELRHRVIAGHVVDLVAPRTLLADAYKALVPTLAAESKGHRYGSSTISLFKELINHRTIYARFEENVAEARTIYESVASTLRGEAHFWLQYGLLELWYGNLEFAENFLRQAESLRPGSPYIQNALGHLYLKQAAVAESSTVAYELRRVGSEILAEQMRTDDSPHSFHIYCSQRLAWLNVWLPSGDERKVELEHLREVMSQARQRFARNRMLKDLQDAIERTYLDLALDNSAPKAQHRTPPTA